MIQDFQMQAEALFNQNGESVQGPLLLTPRLFGDSRGFFFESWNQNVWIEILSSVGQPEVKFVQDNHSRSEKGVLRGLHYQVEPCPQGKLVRCIVGEIFDVAVDLRRSSMTFGKWVGASLSAKNQQQLWIPVGFAHGFLTISDHAEVLYKTTNYWDPDTERAILWDDPFLNIAWPKCRNQLLLSEKDKSAQLITNIKDKDLFV